MFPSPAGRTGRFSGLFWTFFFYRWNSAGVVWAPSFLLLRHSLVSVVTNKKPKTERQTRWTDVFSFFY